MNGKNTSKLQRKSKKKFCIQLKFQCKSSSKQQRKVNSRKIDVFIHQMLTKKRLKLSQRVEQSVFDKKKVKEKVKRDCFSCINCRDK